ncbi:MAG: 23S rRNA (pseudouridine(1915)-N(3))-methyltransferase RlmH [Terriglobia bacterium]
MRIRLIWEGKTRDERLHALQADYAARISRFAELQIDEIPPERGAVQRQKGQLSPAERRLLEKAGDGPKVALDEQGREWNSQEFAAWMERQAVSGTRAIAFLVGGPEGFSAAFRAQSDVLLALSRMTLTRDWARALLLEQIYRSFTIQRGYPYPR